MHDKTTDFSQKSTIQRAAAFFGQPVWSRLFEAFYEKYLAQGRIAGQVTLHHCTAEEQREIARFLNRRLSSHETLVVRLPDFQHALDTSGFPCALSDLLTALYPERSHLTRPHQRELRVQSQQRFAEALSALAETVPTEGKGKRWLLTGAHGRDYLVRRYKNADPTIQNQVSSTVHMVIVALDQLPIPPRYERLSLFAQRICGDPHGLDAQSFAGRLFLHSLADLTAQVPPPVRPPTRAGEEVTDEGVSVLQPSNNLERAEEEKSLEQEHEQQRHLLYYEAGLLTDTISSTVAVFQLAAAEDAAGQRDPWLENAHGRVLTLSLRQLLAWNTLIPASPQVYVFENPQVFEDIIDELQRHGANGTGEPQALPTLICTSGWPSVAAMRLLSLLTETNPQLVFHYSGDFDLAGLRIAVFLQKRYPAQCRLWRFDPSSYLAALHQKSPSFDSAELASLRSFPAQFAPLVVAMQKQGRKAYQEGITSLLLKDTLYSCAF